LGFEASHNGKKVISVSSTASFNAQGKIAYGDGVIAQFARAGKPSKSWP